MLNLTVMTTLPAGLMMIHDQAASWPLQSRGIEASPLRSMAYLTTRSVSSLGRKLMATTGTTNARCSSEAVHNHDVGCIPIDGGCGVPSSDKESSSDTSGKGDKGHYQC